MVERYSYYSVKLEYDISSRLTFGNELLGYTTVSSPGRARATTAGSAM